MYGTVLYCTLYIVHSILYCTVHFQVKDSDNKVVVQVQGPNAQFATVPILKKAGLELLKAVGLSEKRGDALKEEMNALKRAPAFVEHVHRMADGESD